MLLLEAHDIKHYIGDRLLLDVKQLNIYENDRIGLIGKNGSGKTTLLNILAGKTRPGEGHVIRHSRCELLPQLKRTDPEKSGGEITQQYILDVMAKNPELIFADEPTTHLDTNHIEWLEKLLRERPGAFVVVSHDRAFLDALCTTIWELDDGKVTVYPGNYSAYADQKELERKEQTKAYEQYVKKKKQLEEALWKKKEKAERAVKKPKKVSPSEAKITGAKPYFAKKQKKLQKTAKAIQTRIEKLEKVEKVKELPPVKMDLPNEETIKNRIIIRVEDVEGVIGSRRLWKKTSFQIRGGDKVAVTGANGSGKTTFINMIVNGAEGITVSPAVKIGYFHQHLQIIDPDKTILENVKSSSKHDETLIRTVLARMHFYRDDVFKPAGVLSGGEQVKVALAKIFLSNINTLVLDEPTNFLDIEAVEALESLLKEYQGTVLFISHDRRFIKNVATKIIEIRDGKMHFFPGTAEEYEEAKKREAKDNREERLMVLEMKITDVLSRLSIEPSEELEAEFQKLLKEKRRLMEKTE